MRYVVLAACLLGLLFFPANESDGISINILDPTGSLPPGPQQPYGSHDGCVDIYAAVVNSHQSGPPTTFYGFVEMGDDDWYCPESIEFTFHSYAITVWNDSDQQPYANTGGSVSQ